MHSYLRAIGYSDVKSRMDAEKLIKGILANASERRVTPLSETTLLVEASYECAEGIGITVRGEMEAENTSFQDTGALHVENYFPYFRGTNVSMHEDVFINKRVDTEAYNGMCDDSRVGVSLIFYLQNAVDYLEAKQRSPETILHPVTLSALSLGGHILLPAAENKLEMANISRQNQKRTQMIAEAKTGNQEAMENLTVDDLDMYSMISERAKKEDVYSIVDTSFIPYGTESDVYIILGHIEAFRYLENYETKEELCLMQISCNDLSFDLCIHRDDLLGEPAVGRRFRGTVWMQGMVDFI